MIHCLLDPIFLFYCFQFVVIRSCTLFRWVNNYMLLLYVGSGSQLSFGSFREYSILVFPLPCVPTSITCLSYELSEQIPIQKF